MLVRSAGSSLTSTFFYYSEGGLRDTKSVHNVLANNME